MRRSVAAVGRGDDSTTPAPNDLAVSGPFDMAHAASDPAARAGFGPFGIHVVGARIVVTYAKQHATMHDDVAGPGNGYVSVFDFEGRSSR